MKIARRINAVAPLGLAYFVATLISLWFTNLGTHVVFLWSATAVMATNLNAHSRKSWFDRVAACFIGGVAAAAIGLPDYFAILVFVTANIFEGFLASFLLSRWRRTSGSPIGSLPWLGSYVVPVGIVVPAIIALTLIPLVGFAKPQVLPTVLHIAVGHALGNMLFVPLVHLVLKNGPLALWRDTWSKHGKEAAMLLGLVAAVTAAVFSQNRMPLLFIPILPVILVAFRLGYGPSAVAVGIVAFLGTALTLAGQGPVMLIHGPISTELIFIQVFLVSILLTALPIAAELEVREKLHQTLRNSEERYRLLAEHSTDIIMHIGTDERIRFISPSISRVTGHQMSELVGQYGVTLVADEDRAEAIATHHRVKAAAGEIVTFEHRAQTPDGDHRWLEVRARLIVGKDGRSEGVISMLRDITARKATEERLSQEAYSDPLTGVANRRGFEYAVEQRLSVRAKGSTDCIALFDIDHFKRVNDRHGHDVGDAVLNVLGRVMQSAIRDGDTVARMGGEEFAVYMPDCSLAMALSICEKIRTDTAKQTVMADQAVVRVTISGGVALFDHDYLPRALKQADQALYVAKRGGRDQLALAA